MDLWLSPGDFYLAGSMIPGQSGRDQGSGGWNAGFAHISLSFDRGKILLTKEMEVRGDAIYVW